ncbi:MAG: TIGR01459 family HAD-type hydrolase [Alphaproteobacteria bacterium]|nr:TIGR01459 family HAD-type hydrolase [Alphaproteobacteria bacterium]
MSKTPFIENLSAVADRYDALLCDAWGVIHDGRNVFPDVAEALRRFRHDRGPVIILTNAPKPAHIIGPQLDGLGLARDCYDAIVTSGEATRAEIENRRGMSAFRIGWDSDLILYEGLDVRFAELDKAEFIVCTGLSDVFGFDPVAYRSLLAKAAVAGKEMICANPDLVVRWKGDLIYCAGAVAREYEALGGPVIYAGKPYPAVYDLSFRLIERAICEPDGPVGDPVGDEGSDSGGPAVSAKRVLAIGDGAGTDILGANRYGVDAIYVTGDGGVHQGGDDAGAIDAALAEAGATAMAAMRRLKW